MEIHFSVGVYIHQLYITTVCNALVSLFLHDYSVRYHSLNPSYIHERLKTVGSEFHPQSVARPGRRGESLSVSLTN